MSGRADRIASPIRVVRSMARSICIIRIFARSHRASTSLATECGEDLIAAAGRRDDVRLETLCVGAGVVVDVAAADEVAARGVAVPVCSMSYDDERQSTNCDYMLMMAAFAVETSAATTTVRVLEETIFEFGDVCGINLGASRLLEVRIRCFRRRDKSLEYIPCSQ